MRRRNSVSGTAAAGSPAIVTAPAVGARRRFTSLSVVVFPAPLRPRRTRVSSAPTENEIPSTRDRPFPGSSYRKSFTSSTMATERTIYLCCSSMTQPGAPAPLGMSDFFALEAGEYLDRLDALLQPPTPPAADELVRLARALMASQQGIARAAMGLEALARGVREGRRPWDAAIKQITTRAIDDLKIFVRKAASWTEADTAKAEALASQLEQLGERASGQVRAAEALGLDAGARAFVAREGAAIASALDRAGRALRTNPLANEPHQQVLKSLQPLRGLAALNDLPPLPDLLEGIEQAMGEITRTASTAPPGFGDTIAELFQMAATAIAHAARAVAERGRPDPESAEFRKFAGLLVQFIQAEPEVVPIESVATIVRRGTAPAGSAPATALGRLESVSYGEHLRQAADSLERAPSATQRELRAHTLAGTFRALASELRKAGEILSA